MQNRCSGAWSERSLNLTLNTNSWWQECTGWNFDSFEAVQVFGRGDDPVRRSCEKIRCCLSFGQVTIWVWSQKLFGVAYMWFSIWGNLIALPLDLFAMFSKLRRTLIVTKCHVQSEILDHWLIKTGLGIHFTKHWTIVKYKNTFLRPYNHVFLSLPLPKVGAIFVWKTSARLHAKVLAINSIWCLDDFEGL